MNNHDNINLRVHLNKVGIKMWKHAFITTDKLNLSKIQNKEQGMEVS